ncbi:MAG: hypothetical protein LBO00_07205, partial [Zoogloeaceae bacterium]|nr:hypothetical protein [Zoogloeaceae bacterium]
PPGDGAEDGLAADGFVALRELIHPAQSWNFKVADDEGDAQDDAKFVPSPAGRERELPSARPRSAGRGSRSMRSVATLIFPNLPAA